MAKLVFINSSGAAAAYDASAVTYFTAAGITDTTEKDAVNQLVLDLKGTGNTTNNTDVWSDMNAIYPVSPTSLSAAAYNLKDPTSYNITWQNSPTHSADGVVGNGLDQYGDTNFNPSTDGLRDDFGCTISINTNVTINSIDMGVRNGSTTFNQLNSYFNGDANSLINQIATFFPSFANANTIGVYTAVRTSSSYNEIYKGGVSQSFTTRSSVAPPNGNIFLLARNLVGSGAENFTTRRVSFAAIHAGLTANQVKDLYDAITTYNATVLVSDLDAAAYISSAGITDRAECKAINQLVKDLKGTGSTTNNTDVWSYMSAIYPISPTSLDAAKYNLKDPTNYNITWANSPTHSADGVAGNGSNQWGDTNFNPSTSASLNDFGCTISINTNITTDTVDMGVRAGSDPFVHLNSHYGGRAQGIINANNVGFTSAVNGNAIGVYTAVRRSSTDTELYKGGVSIDTQSDSSSSIPNGNIFILARNRINVGPEFLTTRRFSFAAIHTGLTDNQAQDLYDAITTYNTALNR